LLSTAGRCRITRHLPAPRRSFAVTYGSTTTYRTDTREKIWVTARPDPDGPPVERTLDVIAEDDRFLSWR
jgi:hypothetical protein